MTLITAITGSVPATSQQTPDIDPLVFGLVYSVSIPLFIASGAWLVRNIRSKISLILPSLLSTLFITAACVYISTAALMIPAWLILLLSTVAAAGIGIAWAALDHTIPKASRRRLPRKNRR